MNIENLIDMTWQRELFIKIRKSHDELDVEIELTFYTQFMETVMLLHFHIFLMSSVYSYFCFGDCSHSNPFS